MIILKQKNYFLDNEGNVITGDELKKAQKTLNSEFFYGKLHNPEEAEYFKKKDALKALRDVKTLDNISREGYKDAISRINKRLDPKIDYLDDLDNGRFRNKEVERIGEEAKYWIRNYQDRNKKFMTEASLVPGGLLRKGQSREEAELKLAKRYLDKLDREEYNKLLDLEEVKNNARASARFKTRGKTILEKHPEDKELYNKIIDTYSKGHNITFTEGVDSYSSSARNTRARLENGIKNAKKILKTEDMSVVDKVLKGLIPNYELMKNTNYLVDINKESVGNPYSTAHEVGHVLDFKDRPLASSNSDFARVNDIIKTGDERDLEKIMKAHKIDSNKLVDCLAEEIIASNNADKLLYDAGASEKQLARGHRLLNDALDTYISSYKSGGAANNVWLNSNSHVTDRRKDLISKVIYDKIEELVKKKTTSNIDVYKELEPFFKKYGIEHLGWDRIKKHSDLRATVAAGKVLEKLGKLLYH